MKRSIHIVCQNSGSLNDIIEPLVPFLKKEFVVTREGELEPLFRDILLLHHLQPDVIKEEVFETFNKKVLIQPIDGTEIKKEFIPLFEKFDLIIAPAAASLRILRQSGVKTKIVIIPNFFKPELTVIENIDLEKSIPEFKSKPFIFYHESTLNKRKGFRELCYSYLDAFSDTPNCDKVLLVIKGLDFSHPYNKEIEIEKDLIIERQKYYKNPAKIVKISQHLSEEKLNALMQKSNCYVQLSQIEGFGIPLLKAAALEKPIIALNNDNSGYVDFLNGENAYFTSSYKIIKEHPFWLYDKNSLWDVPFITSAKNTFKNVYSDFLSNNLKKTYDVNRFKLNVVAEQYLKTLSTL